MKFILTPHRRRRKCALNRYKKIRKGPGKGRFRSTHLALSPLQKYFNKWIECASGKKMKEEPDENNRRVSTFIGLGKYMVDRQFYQHIELDMRKFFDR